MRRQVQEDPFEILFGGRAAERAWYPWYWSAKSCKTPQKPSPSRSANRGLTQENVPRDLDASPRGARDASKQPPEPARESVVEEYIYDPISMRRVLKTSHPGATSALEKSSVEKPSTNRGQSAAKESSAPYPKSPSPLTKRPPRKIESSLDRHLRKEADPSVPSAELKVFESQAIVEGERLENLETLRAGDIRAAFESLKKNFTEREKTLQEQTDKRRQNMQEAFEKRMSEIETEFVKETSKSDCQSRPSSSMDPAAPISTGIQDQKIVLHHAREEQEEADALATQKHKQQEADAKLASEIRDQKAAMDAHEAHCSKAVVSDHGLSSVSLGEGDMNAQVLLFATSERWYKKQAPHALAKERAILAKREEREAKDRELVREIQNIYESTYGVIDTKHQQGLTLLSQQNNVYEDTSPRHSAPQVAIPHPQPSKSLLPSAVSSEGDKVTQKSSSIPAKHVTTTFPQLCAPIRARPSFQQCLKLAWAAETNLWTILEWMQQMYLSDLPHLDKVRASKLLAQLVNNDDEMQANIQALVMSDLELRCPNTWLHLMHSRSDRRGCSFERKLLSKILGSSGEQVLNTQLVSRSRERTNHIALAKSEKQVYKILALSFDTHEVTSATTSSSLYESSTPPKSAASILSHLSHPASFIPHIEALQHTNFELVAGSRNMLVYKQVPIEPIQSIQKAPNLSYPEYDTSALRNQNERFATSRDELARKTKNPRTDEAVTQNNASQPGGSSFRITVNSPSGGTVKISSVSVSSPEQAPTGDTPASSEPQTAREASTSIATQSPEHSNAEPQRPSPIKDSLPPEENLTDNPEEAETSSKHLREGPRRRRRGFWKRFKRLALRSFLLGGLCYFAGCFSVWYQKRKEALERAEKRPESSFTPKRLY